VLENNAPAKVNTAEKNSAVTSLSQNDIKGKLLDLKKPLSHTVTPMSSNNSSNGKASTPGACTTNQNFTAPQQGMKYNLIDCVK
jgi:hypothetical protein